MNVVRRVAVIHKLVRIRSVQEFLEISIAVFVRIGRAIAGFIWVEVICYFPFIGQAVKVGISWPCRAGCRRREIFGLPHNKIISVVAARIVRFPLRFGIVPESRLAFAGSDAFQSEFVGRIVAGNKYADDWKQLLFKLVCVVCSYGHCAERRFDVRVASNRIEGF